MKLLVTGGTGMVGQALRHVLPDNIEAMFLSSHHVDLRNRSRCNDFFAFYKPTHVIHLAARVGGVLANQKYNADFFHDNILINTHVLRCCQQFNVQKLVSLLSCCIYPDGAEIPLKVSDLHNGEPHFTNYGYAYAKRMLEVQTRSYNQQYDTNFVCLIPTNIYGPDDNFHLENSHVVPALIRKIHQAKLKNEKPVMWGTGTPLRELTYSFDIADMLWWTMTTKSRSTMNIGTNEEISIKDIVSHIAQCLDFNPEDVIWDDSKPDGQFRKPTYKDDFFAEYTGKITPFAEGVKKMIDWYLSVYPNIRGL